MLPQPKPLTPVITRHVTSSSWPEYSILHTKSPFSSKCFHYSCYVTHYACFYVMRAVKVFYFIQLLQLTVIHINNGFSAKQSKQAKQSCKKIVKKRAKAEASIPIKWIWNNETKNR